MTAKKETKSSKPETATPETTEEKVLSYWHLLAAKFSERDRRNQQVLQNLMTTLSRDPSSLTKSELGEERVELYTDLIGSVRISSKARANVLELMERNGQGTEKLPPIWVPLPPVLEGWKKRQAERATRQAEAEQKAHEAATKKVAQVEAKAAERRAKANERASKFVQLLPDSVKAEQKARTAAREKEEAERTRLRELMQPFIEGEGTLRMNDRGHAVAITRNNVELPLLNVYDMRRQLQAVSGPNDPKQLAESCVFCGRRETLGASEKAWGRKNEKGKREQYHALVIRQIQLKAHSKETPGLLKWPDGNCKLFRVCVCRRCGSLAFQLSKALFTDKRDWCFPQDALTGYLRWQDNQEAPQVEVHERLATIGEHRLYRKQREKGDRRHQPE